MMCRHCLYDIALSSTDRWRLAWNPDNDAAPYECAEHEAGHEPAGDPSASQQPRAARALRAARAASPRHMLRDRTSPSPS